MILGGIGLTVAGSVLPYISTVNPNTPGQMAVLGVLGVASLFVGAVMIILGIASFIVAGRLLKGGVWAWLVTIILSIISIK